MTFIALFVFLLVIFSGSVFACSYFDKKFEEVLPITCVGVILVAFIFGIIGILKISTIVILVICLGLYIASIVKVIKDKNIKEVIKNIFTPGFVVFVILTAMIFVSIYGKVIDATDEYSHWGDIVKVMTSLNDFGTNPNSNSLFKSYLPGVSLFQYFLQEINLLLTGQQFNEWLCYFAYDILGISFFMPICSKLSFKKPISLLAIILVIFMVPLEFYVYAYHGLYVDQFLGYLIGVGALYLLVFRKDDLSYDLLMLSTLIMLVLSKDAGLAFSILLGIAYVLTKLFNRNEKVLSKNNVITIIETIVCIAVPKLLWSLNVKINKASVSFSNPIDFKNLFFVLIGKDDSYRRKVLTTFVEKMTTMGINLGETNIFINYFALLIVSVVGVCIVCKLSEKIFDKTNCNVSKWFIIINTLVFIVGTCVCYMYKFSEDEALILASFDRYLAIVFESMWLFICLATIVLATEYETKCNIILGLLICFVVINTPMEASVSLLTNSYAKNSRITREQYSTVIDRVNNNCDGNKILFIYKDAIDRDLLAFRFTLRPNVIDSYWEMDDELYQIGDEERSVDADGLIDELVSKDIEYVVIYNLDDDFIEKYGNIFEDSDDILENSLYSFDSSSKKLIFCD